MKTCPLCSTTKPKSAFYPRSYYSQHPRCIACTPPRTTRRKQQLATRPHFSFISLWIAT